MIIKCEFCDNEFDNPYEFAEHLEYHIYSLENEKNEQSKQMTFNSTKELDDYVEKKVDKTKKPKKYVVGRGHRMSPVITALIEKNSNKSPQEIRELILKKEGLDVPVQSIYYVRNYNKKKSKSPVKVIADKLDEHTEISEEDFLNEAKANEELSDSVVQILRTYEEEGPVELSQRIKSSLGIYVSPKAILDWKDKN